MIIGLLVIAIPTTITITFLIYAMIATNINHENIKWVNGAIVSVMILSVSMFHSWDTYYADPICLFVWGIIYGFCLSYESI
jgi:hypothetical protein